MKIVLDNGITIQGSEARVAALARVYQRQKDALDANGLPADPRQAALTEARRRSEALHWALKVASMTPEAA